MHWVIASPGQRTELIRPSRRSNAWRSAAPAPTPCRSRLDFSLAPALGAEGIRMLRLKPYLAAID